MLSIRGQVMHAQQVERDRLRHDQDVVAVVVRERRRSEGRRREQHRVGLDNAARVPSSTRASPAPSDRSGQQPANARRRQLAPDVFVVRRSAMEPKLRSSSRGVESGSRAHDRHARSLAFRRGRSRFRCCASAFIVPTSCRLVGESVGERLDERLHVPGCPGDLETLRATRRTRDRVCGRTYRRRQRADVMLRVTDPVGGPDAPIRHRRARH